MGKRASRRLGIRVVVEQSASPTIVDKQSGADPTGGCVQSGVDPAGSRPVPRPAKPSCIGGRNGPDVMDYGAAASIAWIVDAGASYDSAPEGSAERRGGRGCR